MKISVFLFCFALLVNLANAEVQVHAAASLTDAFKEIAALYEKQTGEQVIFNFGASNVLARQIEEGAPGDLFFSADEEKMDRLQGKGLIRAETRKTVLSNTLAIVVSSDSDLKFSSAKDLVSVKGSFAIAEPRTVPAGIYAKEYLIKAGIWNQIIDRLVPTDNVRSALAAVESGNVEAGIVYKTDAGISKNVRIAFEVPREEGPRISYPVAILTETANPESAMKFYSFLLGSKSLDVFEKYGFLVVQ